MSELTHTAVLDRIVDGATAVLLIEEEGEETRREFSVPTGDLPPAARHEGAVVGVTVADGTVLDIEHRPDRERDRRQTAQERFDRLSRRIGDDEQ